MTRPRVDIEGDYDRGGWFLVYVGEVPLRPMTFYTGPFASRSDARRAIPEYRKQIERVLESEQLGALARRHQEGEADPERADQPE